MTLKFVDQRDHSKKALSMESYSVLEDEGPIVKQVWFLSVMYYLDWFCISYTQQLTTWADKSPHLLLLKSSIHYIYRCTATCSILSERSLWYQIFLYLGSHAPVYEGKFNFFLNGRFRQIGVFKRSERDLWFCIKGIEKVVGTYRR